MSEYINFITLVKGDLVCNIPDGMTNGEVLQALFDGLVINDNPIKQKYTIPMTYDFWNAPYKAER